MLVLNNRVGVYVPSTYNGSEEVANSYHRRQVEYVARELSWACGGVTIHEVEGWYLSKDEGLIKEPITFVEAYCTDSTLKGAHTKVYEVAKVLKESMQQESVSICIGSQMVLI